jgi:hypothetical protein
MTVGAIMDDDSQAGEQGVKLTALQQKRRRQRNLAIGLALFAMVGLFYLITLVKLGAGAHH